MSTTEYTGPTEEDRERILDLMRRRAQHLGSDNMGTLAEAEYDAAIIDVFQRAVAVAALFVNPNQALAIIGTLLPIYTRQAFTDPDAQRAYDRMLHDIIAVKLPHVLEGAVPPRPGFN